MNSNIPPKGNQDKKNLKDGLVVAFILVALMWGIKLIETASGLDFSDAGIYPRRISSLPGVIATPFLHKDFMHLFNNTFPVLVSVMGIYYFFRKYALDIIVFSFMTTHLLIWIFARDSYHIGASGLVYTWLAFLFFGGTFAHNKNLMALSLIIVLLYGSLVWGILPVQTDVSWESHLLGGLSGLAFAYFYRQSALPPEKKPDWMDESDDDDENETADNNPPSELPESTAPPVQRSYWNYSNGSGRSGPSDPQIP